MNRRMALRTLLMMAVGLGLGTRPARAQTRYQVVVEGRTVQAADPVLRDGQLLAASAPLLGAMGMRVRWVEADWRLEAYNEEHELAFWAGSRTVFRDGRRHEAPVAAQVVNGLIYVPVWFTAELNGYGVRWDGRVMSISRPGAGRAAQPPSALLGPGFVFPFPRESRYQPYTDDYGEPRHWTPDGEQGRFHEGVDILAEKWTPLVAVAEGTVVRLGWNQYGGWRLQIRPDAAPGYRIYYAHLAGYARGLKEGARVRAGQLIGYVGDSGYGPQGTTGQFVPHLHLGIYRSDGGTINPYPMLKKWERNRVYSR